jgi:hypothetical protein
MVETMRSAMQAGVLLPPSATVTTDTIARPVTSNTNTITTTTTTAAPKRTPVITTTTAPKFASPPVRNSVSDTTIRASVQSAEEAYDYDYGYDYVSAPAPITVLSAQSAAPNDYDDYEYAQAQAPITVLSVAPQSSREGKRDIPSAARGTAASYGELGTFDVQIVKADTYAEYSYVEDSLEMGPDSYKYFEYSDYAYVDGFEAASAGVDTEGDEYKEESILLPPPAYRGL